MSATPDKVVINGFSLLFNSVYHKVYDEALRTNKIDFKRSVLGGYSIWMDGDEYVIGGVGAKDFMIFRLEDLSDDEIVSKFQQNGIECNIRRVKRLVGELG